MSEEEVRDGLRRMRPFHWCSVQVIPSRLWSGVRVLIFKKTKMGVFLNPASSTITPIAAPKSKAGAFPSLPIAPPLPTSHPLAHSLVVSCYQLATIHPTHPLGVSLPTQITCAHQCIVVDDANFSFPATFLSPHICLSLPGVVLQISHSFTSSGLIRSSKSQHQSSPPPDSIHPNKEE